MKLESPAWLTTKLLACIVGGLVLLAIIVGGLSYCQEQRSRAAQARLDSAQAGAASNSAADAINTVSAAGGRDRASEDLTRSNERDIMAAEGAHDKANPALNRAGRAALCKREAYRNTDACKGSRP